MIITTGKNGVTVQLSSDERKKIAKALKSAIGVRFINENDLEKYIPQIIFIKWEDIIPK